jgi:HK97 family phage major capsid protein
MNAMPRLRDVLQRKDEIRSDLSAILAAHPDGNLDDATKARADALEQEATRLTDQERRIATIDALDRRAPGTPLSQDGSDAPFEKAAAAVSILDVLRAASGATDRGAGQARELSTEIARRTGREPSGIFWDCQRSTSVARARLEQRVFGTILPGAGPGGALVATDVSTAPIDLLAPKLVTARLGATTLSGLQGNLAIPRVKQWPTTFWVSENSPLTLSDPATEQVTLTPHHTGAVVELTRQLMQQSSIDCVRFVENMLVSAVAQSIDVAAVSGTNAGGQPMGLLNVASGITIVPLAAVGGPPTWNAIVALIAAVDQNNALDGRLGFAGNAKVSSVLRRTLKSTGDTSSNFVQIEPDTLAGYPYVASQNIPSNGTKSTGTNLSALIFGDWSALIIGYWSALDIAINTQGDSVFLKGNAQVRCMASLDIQLRHALALAAITDMVTT